MDTADSSRDEALAGRVERLQRDIAEEVRRANTASVNAAKIRQDADAGRTERTQFLPGESGD
ncbi:MAG TPA: hypothetical protein VFF65_05145 [Phycisphaerales bacterium]|nr:hypothetical protein [Phycisphaerales bacterium]